MGISIDESIENLVLLKKIEDSLGNISGYTNSVASQSLGCAIDIMHKYQKIEEIYYHQSGRALEDSLRAVIENEFDWRVADDNTKNGRTVRNGK